MSLTRYLVKKYLARPSGNDTYCGQEILSTDTAAERVREQWELTHDDGYATIETLWNDAK